MISIDTLQGLRKWILIFTTVVMSIAPRFFYLNIPLMNDEGAYAYVADTIRLGGLPYIDAFDHKPPLIYYLFYFAFKLFGHSVSSPRILANFFVAAACFLLIILVYRLTKNLSAALFSSLILGLASLSSAYQGLSVNTELFILPLIIGGILLLSEEEPPIHNFFTAGLLFGVGFITKQPVAIIAVFVFIIPWINLLKISAYWFRAACVFGLGGVLPLSGVMLFYSFHGGLATFWECCFSYNFGYMGALTLLQSLSKLYFAVKVNLLYDFVTWFAGVAGALLLFKSSKHSFNKAQILMIMIGSFIAAAMGRYFYPHYFVFLLPILSLSAGLGLSLVLKMRHGNYMRAVAVVLVCIAYYGALRFIPSSDSDILKLGNNGIHHKTYLRAKSIGDFLRTNSPSGATVFMIGSEPSIYFYSGLRSASRIYYFLPLVAPTRMKENLQREVLADLVIRPADFVVIINEAHSLNVRTIDGNMYINELLDRFANYRLIGIIADNNESLVLGDYQKMRSIAGKGASMLLLGRPTDDTLNGLTFSELLGKKGI